MISRYGKFPVFDRDIFQPGQGFIKIVELAVNKITGGYQYIRRRRLHRRQKPFQTAVANNHSDMEIGDLDDPEFLHLGGEFRRFDH